MSKYLVTLGAGTGQGTIVQCASTSATINGKPIAVVGDIASHPYGPDGITTGLRLSARARRPEGWALLPNTLIYCTSNTTKR